MKYTKKDYKKKLGFIKKLKGIDNDDTLTGILSSHFYKITKEQELNDVGTNLVDMIKKAKFLKGMQIKLRDFKTALLTFLAVDNFESGIVLICELFNKDEQYAFDIYDTSRGLLNEKLWIRCGRYRLL